MEKFAEIASQVSTFLWGWPMIILLLGTHLYLTIRLRFPQRYVFKAIKLSVTKDKGSPGDVSQFSALATSLAAIAPARCAAKQGIVDSLGHV